MSVGMPLYPHRLADHRSGGTTEGRMHNRALSFGYLAELKPSHSAALSSGERAPRPASLRPFLPGTFRYHVHMYPPLV